MRAILKVKLFYFLNIDLSTLICQKQAAQSRREKKFTITKLWDLKINNSAFSPKEKGEMEILNHSKQAGTYPFIDSGFST